MSKGAFWKKRDRRWEHIKHHGRMTEGHALRLGVSEGLQEKKCKDTKARRKGHGWGLQVLHGRVFLPARPKKRESVWYLHTSPLRPQDVSSLHHLAEGLRLHTFPQYCHLLSAHPLLRPWASMNGASDPAWIPTPSQANSDANT